MKTLRRTALILAGSLALALGLVGIFIPILPTTPFLLLAAFCYLHSSKRLYAWLIRHRIFGQYIEDYMTHRAIRLGVKIAALALLWLSLGLSIVLVPSPAMRIILPLIGLAVSWHVLSLRTLRDPKSR
jgi:hypothetical protein